MFCEYEHMENHYNVIKNIPHDVKTNVKFIALEKIHGTNYSFLCDGKQVIPCKRSSTLGTDRGYYGHGEPFERYKNDILVIFNHIKNIYPETKHIQLYCELFGGKFNGKTKKGYKCVQKNTNYNDSNEIMAYDLKITQNDDSHLYLDMIHLIEIFNKLMLKLKLVPIIKIDYFDEIMNLNSKFVTQVPAEFGLEHIENNFAEGYVIKPITEMLFQDQTRLIFKYKNPDFLEIAESKDIVVEKTMTFQQIYLEKLKTYVTKNRFDNIVTKYVDDWLNSEITNEIELFLINKMFDDIKNDFTKDNQNDNEYNPNYLNANEKSLLGFLTGFVKKMIRTR